MISITRRRLVGAIVAATLGMAAMATLPIVAQAAPASSLLAIGDSYVFGYSTAAGTPQNIGDNGYVRDFADWLGTHNGGLGRPQVLNLARPGETTDSFSTFASTSSGPNGSGFYNTSYLGAIFTQAQGVNTVLTNQGFFPPIKDIVYQLGGNDVLALFLSSAFQNANDTDRKAMITAGAAQLTAFTAGNIDTLATDVPGADIFVLDYPDPFAGLGIGNPLGVYSAFAATALRDDYAATFAGAPPNIHFVDLYDPFVGHETAYSLITTTDGGFPDFHPSSTGYGVIAGLLENAASVTVPEPGTLALAGLGLAGAVLGIIRRRRTA